MSSKSTNWHKILDSYEQNMATARLIEQLFLDNFHVGIEETNILFDIWTGNASYAPIHHTMAEKNKPRDPKKHKVWIGRSWVRILVISIFF